jgi:hypothetical protein
MAVNLLIYPLDYPATIVGPSDLELRVIELEDKMESVSILSLQDRRDGGNDAIDLELRDTTIGVFHSAIPRFGFRDRNLGTKGFVLGGETSGSLTGRIAKFDYLFETPTLIGADIGIARHSGAGTSAVAAGYLSGGNTATNITAKIEKLFFDNESVSLLAQQLQVPLSELVGFATTADSFTFGGLDGVTNSIVGQVRSLKHASEAVSLLAATLAVPKSNATVVGTTASGFIVGGKTAIGTTVYSQSIEKMTWITQSIAPSSLSLAPNGVAFSVGVGNDFSGYILGGRSGAVNTATISRIAHTTESISPISIALTTPRSDATAVGSSRIGYLMAGGTDPNGEFRSLAAVSSISRLTFVGAENPIERLEPLSFSLPYAATGASGISDYSPGTYSSNSVSIVNLYDGIYSKLGHVHDERYPLQSDVYYRPELRRKLNANLNLFVNILNTTPAAVGLGSAANPFGTIAAAIAYARTFDFNNYALKIKVADGIYPEAAIFSATDFVGLNESGILIEGNIQTPAAVVIATSQTTAATAVKVFGELRLGVRGFRLTSSRSVVDPENSRGLEADRGGIVDYGDIVFGSGFGFHVLIQAGGRGNFTGNARITGDCYNHVRLRNGGSWSTTPSSGPYATIVFANPIAVDTLLECSYGGLFNFTTNSNDRALRFTTAVAFVGPAVTGYSFVIDEDGAFYHGPLTNFDSGAPDWGFIPGSLGAKDFRREVRTDASNQNIRGIKSFANPISIPDGVLAQDGVNLQQLLEHVKISPGQRRIRLGAHIQLLLGSFAIGGSNTIFSSPFGTIYGSGSWGTAGPLSIEILFNTVPGSVDYVGNPLMFTSEDQMCQRRVKRYPTKFTYDIDEVAGYQLGTTTVYVDWWAIGFI